MKRGHWQKYSPVDTGDTEDTDRALHPETAIMPPENPRILWVSPLSPLSPVSSLSSFLGGVLVSPLIWADVAVKHYRETTTWLGKR